MQSFVSCFGSSRLRQLESRSRQPHRDTRRSRRQDASQHKRRKEIHEIHETGQEIHGNTWYDENLILTKMTGDWRFFQFSQAKQNERVQSIVLIFTTMLLHGVTCHWKATLRPEHLLSQFMLRSTPTTPYPAGARALLCFLLLFFSFGFSFLLLLLFFLLLQLRIEEAGRSSSQIRSRNTNNHKNMLSAVLRQVSVPASGAKRGEQVQR